jgi:hypothetical protein
MKTKQKINLIGMICLTFIFFATFEGIAAQQTVRMIVPACGA